MDKNLKKNSNNCGSHNERDDETIKKLSLEF